MCSKLSLTVTHSVGFDCLCDKPTHHLTLVSPDRKSWVCSEDDTIIYHHSLSQAETVATNGALALEATWLDLVAASGAREGSKSAGYWCAVAVCVFGWRAAAVCYCLL